MKRLIAALSATVLLLASAPAWAGGYGHGGHGYGHGGYTGKGHGYRYRPSHGRRHYGGGAIIVGALVGGLILGHLLTRPAYAAPAYRAPVYYAPPPRPVLGNCRATTGTGYYAGRPAQFGGTMCFDGYGRGYVTPGSEYFIGYFR